MKRLELDELWKGEDWALAKTTAKLTAQQEKKKRLTRDIQQREDMPEPP